MNARIERWLRASSCGMPSPTVDTQPAGIFFSTQAHQRLDAFTRATIALLGVWIAKCSLGGASLIPAILRTRCPARVRKPAITQSRRETFRKGRSRGPLGLRHLNSRTRSPSKVRGNNNPQNEHLSFLLDICWGSFQHLHLIELARE